MKKIGLDEETFEKMKIEKHKKIKSLRNINISIDKTLSKIPDFEKQAEDFTKIP